MHILTNFAAQIRLGGLGRNGLFSLVQAIITIICLFASYRLLIAQEGLAGLGLWSLMMLFGGMAATFDISGASALARSVSRHEIDFADTGRTQVVHTVLITSMIVNGALLLLLLLALPTLLPHLVADGQLAQAWRLVPWIAAIMLTAPLSVGISASIDGMMRADQRAILVSVSAVASLAAALLAIPRYGVVGIAISQMVQQTIVVIGGWVLLRRHVPQLGWWPSQWQRSVFVRTTGYAMRLNLVGALGLLLEPLTKYCINLVGGTGAVGVYELAARLAMQLRNLVVSSTSPLIPAFARVDRENSSEMADLLRRAQRYAGFAALVVAFSSLAGAPLMSLVILGHISPEVLRANALLAAGWSINIFSLPLYLAAQGQGVLRWNMVSHAVIGVCVIVGTWALVPLLGSVGVILGVASGLVLGALTTMLGNASLFAAGATLRREAPLLLLLATIILLACAVMAVSMPGALRS